MLEEAETIRSSKVHSPHAHSELQVEVHPQRDTVRIAAGGALDRATVEALQAQLDELRDAGFEHVVLDLQALTFMDSSGAQLILGEERLARGSGRTFSVIRGPLERTEAD